MMTLVAESSIAFVMLGYVGTSRYFDILVASHGYHDAEDILIHVKRIQHVSAQIPVK